MTSFYYCHNINILNYHLFWFGSISLQLDNLGKSLPISCEGISFTAFYCNPLSSQDLRTPGIKINCLEIIFLLPSQYAANLHTPKRQWSCSYLWGVTWTSIYCISYKIRSFTQNNVCTNSFIKYWLFMKKKKTTKKLLLLT